MAEGFLPLKKNDFMKPSEITSVEYSPYFKSYIDKVEDINLIEALTKGAIESNHFFSSLSEDILAYRYAENKWTPKEILLHLIDSERTFSYRALHFARTDNASLEGFDENVFAKNSNANSRTIKSLLKEYNTVREASILLFESFSKETLLRSGMANNNLLSVRAAGFLICGHEIHHRKIIKERYL